ncbi:MAG: YjgP/YjgQ family permease [Porphyromonadaceae bacterium]|nr:YjgP/YjgQ family permease [Porphyromonadaceae bacterium]
MNYQKIGLKKIDIYIIKKFLGTFFYSIILILSIAVVFDITEKIDDFYEHNATLKVIVFDYYLNFIPFYANMFTPLFTFISVIFFTSKMANNTEIIAILSSGVSFNRLMRPYFISAMVITLLAFVLGAYIIPQSTKGLLEFENKYIEEFKTDNTRNVQMEIEKGVIMYIERYEISSNTGYSFSLEKFEDKTLVSRLTAQTVVWDSLYHWTVKNYVHREFDGMREKLTRGSELDTLIQVRPNEFFITAKEAPQLDLNELKTFIDQQKNRVVGNVQAFEDEYYRRYSFPISVLIMTLIGVSLSSRKIRGGMGLNLGIGLGLSSLFVIFTTMSTTFAVNNAMPILLAVWLPNIIFLSIGIFLYVRAPK